MIREMANVVLAQVKTQFVVTSIDYQRVYLPMQRPDIPTDETLRRAFFPFVVVWPSRRSAADVRRLSDDSSVIAFRVVTMCCGRTYGEVAYAEEKVAAALERQRLTIAGYSSTPVQFESSQQAEPDADLGEFIVSSTVWTFVSTKQQAA